MGAFRRSLPAALLALLAARAAGQGAANSTEGVIAYVRGCTAGPAGPAAAAATAATAAAAVFAPLSSASPPASSQPPQNGVGTGYTQVIITPSSGYGGAPLALRIQLTASQLAFLKPGSAPTLLLVQSAAVMQPLSAAGACRPLLPPLALPPRPPPLVPSHVAAAKLPSTHRRSPGPSPCSPAVQQ